MNRAIDPEARFLTNAAAAQHSWLAAASEADYAKDMLLGAYAAGSDTYWLMLLFARLSKRASKAEDAWLAQLPLNEEREER